MNTPNVLLQIWQSPFAGLGIFIPTSSSNFFSPSSDDDDDDDDDDSEPSFPSFLFGIRNAGLSDNQSLITMWKELIIEYQGEKNTFQFFGGFQF